MERWDKEPFVGYIDDIKLSGTLYFTPRIPDHFYAYFLMSDKIAPEEKINNARNMFVETIKKKEEVQEKTKKIATAIVPIDIEGKQRVNIQNLFYDVCKECGKYADYVAIYKTEEGVDKEALQKELATIELKKQEEKRKEQEEYRKREFEEAKYVLQYTPDLLFEQYGYDPKNAADKGNRASIKSGNSYPFNDIHKKEYYTKRDFEFIWWNSYRVMLPVRLENWYKKHEIPPLEIDMVLTNPRKPNNVLVGFISAVASMMSDGAYVFRAEGNGSLVNSLFDMIDERKILNGIAFAEKITPAILSLMETDEEMYIGFEETLLRTKQGEVKDERSYSVFLKKAMDAAHRLAETEEHPEYYLAAEEFMKKRLETIQKRVEELKPLWQEVRSNRAAQRRERRRVQCENCMIDGSRTTFPKGWQEAYIGLFTDEPAQSEKNGYITFKNGYQITWKYVEDDGRIKIRNQTTNKLYNRVDDMIDDLIAYCKRMFCD